VLARLLSTTVLGMVCGQWIGGLFAQWLSWRASFVVLSALFAAAGLLVLRESRAPAHAVPGAVTHGFFRQVRSIFDQPWARRVLVIAVIEGAAVYSVMAFVPSALHARFGLSFIASAAILSLFGVGGFAYTRMASVLIRRLAEPGLTRLGGAGLCLALLTLAFMPHWAFGLPACLLMGLAFYMLHSTLQTHATQMAPHARGTAVSVFACALFLGQSAGVVIVAFIVDHWSAQAAFALAGGVLLALGFVFASLIVARQARDAALA